MFFFIFYLSCRVSGVWELPAVGLWSKGERSEPSGTARQRASGGFAKPSLASRYFPPLAFGKRLSALLLLSLLRQGSQTADACAGDGGGVCELVLPMNGLWPVQVSAGAAHAQCPKLEPLLELWPRPQARMHKDELSHAYLPVDTQSHENK